MDQMRQAIVLFFFIAFISCKNEEQWIDMEVVATAYNSTAAQTEGDPNITAWGDTLTPTTKSIAVSRDLIEKGLTHNTKVKIEGFEGIYVVNDKMHSKWRNRIDIYFGADVKAARQWGRKKVKIRFLCK
jgi:3D (Asp-Asp-Asp) domain-containing protein